ncbi:MAG TPA: type II toxin-antitoxin system VapC family toxin [Gemmatimonadaceae bacterium]|nr:type II toxin-antitoxin system VapC family toxin [Gemmatimonadaceae bacterium]
MAPRFRAAMRSGVAVSSITVAELQYGVERSRNPARERVGVGNLLGAVAVLPFDSKAAEGYGMLRRYLERRGEVIGPFDLLIAAHAVAQNATLVTNNTREFSRVPTLQMEDWL